MSNEIKIELNEGQSVRVYDHNGNELGVYRSNEAVEESCSFKPISDDHGFIEFDDHDLDRFIEFNVMGWASHQRMVKAVDKLSEYMKKTDRIDGIPVEGSSVCFTVFFNSSSSALNDMEFSRSHPAPLRRFLVALDTWFVGMDFDRSRDGVVRMLSDYICDDWCQESLSDIAQQVWKEYESNTSGKKFFKAIYESEKLSEFRVLYEDMYDALLALHGSFADDAMWIELERENPRASKYQLEQFREQVVDRYIGYHVMWPYLA